MNKFQSNSTSHTLIIDKSESYDTCNQIAENDQDCNINVITRSGFDTDVNLNTAMLFWMKTQK